VSRARETLPAAYFDRLYATDSDPWRFASSDYEAAKYTATLAALSKARYRSALEVGCSIGVLTSQLALRCDHLIAVDTAATALDQARRRCAAQTWTAFARLFVPGQWPVGSFDLILLSEIVYYLTPADVERLADRASGSLRVSGEILLVHWTGPTDYPLSGDAAAEALIAATDPFLRVVRQQREEAYRLDLLARR
jgi:SAM-dependent methyltransferase